MKRPKMGDIWYHFGFHFLLLENDEKHKNMWTVINLDTGEIKQFGIHGNMADWIWMG